MTIYASSGSVYGIQDADRVTEDLPHVPISEYNKTEDDFKVLLSCDSMTIQIIRPTTVCGLSKRMQSRRIRQSEI